MTRAPAQPDDRRAARAIIRRRRDGREVPAPRPPSTAEGPRTTRLHLQLTRPRADLTVLTAAGDIDSTNAAELAGMLWPALLGEHSSIVLDFKAVTFLGVAGLEPLSAANTYAPHRALKIVLLTGRPAVERAVRAAGLDATLHREPDLAACAPS